MDEIQTNRREHEISGGDRLEGALSVAAITAGVDFQSDKQWSRFLNVARSELRERGVTLGGVQRNV